MRVETGFDILLYIKAKEVMCLKGICPETDYVSYVSRQKFLQRNKVCKKKKNLNDQRLGKNKYA